MHGIYLGLIFILISFQALASKQLEDMSLEQLMNISITGASKYEQKQNEVAAAVSIITRKDIKAYGWRTLNEALASLPGIHTTYDHQYNFLGTRGLDRKSVV